MQGKINKSIFVSANAGSGKTYQLTHRIADLLVKGKVAPDKILCVTYTKVAASDMQEKLLKLLQNDYPDYFNEFIQNAKKPLITTFHAFCQKILSTFRAEAEIASALNVPDDIDLSVLIKDSINLLIQSRNICSDKVLNLSMRGLTDECKEILKSKTKFEEIFHNSDYIESVYNALNVKHEIFDLNEKIAHIENNLIESLNLDDFHNVLNLCLFSEKSTMQKHAE